MSHVILSLPFILSPVGIGQCSPTRLFAINPLAMVLISIGVIVGSHSVFFAFLSLALVSLFRNYYIIKSLGEESKITGPSIDSIAIFPVSFSLSLVNIPIYVVVGSLAMFHSFVKLSFKSFPICKKVCAYSMKRIILPFANIFISIRVMMYPFSMS